MNEILEICLKQIRDLSYEERVVNCAECLKDLYTHFYQKYDQTRCYNLTCGLFCIASANDGAAKPIEKAMFNEVFKKTPVTYEKFHEIVVKYNQKGWRENIAKEICSLEDKKLFISAIFVLCIISMVDNQLHPNEEKVINGYCLAYENKFHSK